MFKIEVLIILCYDANFSAMTDETKQQPVPKKGGVEVYGILQKYLKGTAGESDEYLQQKLKERYDFGKKKYGQALMTDDGRDSVRDLEEELLDTVYYLASNLHTKKNIDKAKMMIKAINGMIEKSSSDVVDHKQSNSEESVISDSLNFIHKFTTSIMEKDYENTIVHLNSIRQDIEDKMEKNKKD